MLSIIANAHSGKGVAEKNIKKIAKFCLAQNIPYAFYFTEKRGHATELARQLTATGGEIAVLGGDGTFHEVLNGIVDLENTTLGFIPSGRGNDFVRAAKCSLDPIQAVKDILRGEKKRIDFIEVGDKRCLNVAGTGLDVDVLQRVAGKTNKITYLVSLVYCLRHFDPYRVTVTVNGEAHEYDCIMVGICNGIAIGGNMRLSPVSKIDDGKLDVIVITMPENGKIMPVLPKFVKGKHMDMSITKHFVCDEVTVQTGKSVQLDGEIYEGLPLACKVVKGGLWTYKVSGEK
ncbi:MAG: diacylglycerol kinase family lipid kinase [Clostridiales bacterium]|nr:diacylglycerol kinase family lipid kinase [Clostridiales bacterium]